MKLTKLEARSAKIFVHIVTLYSGIQEHFPFLPSQSANRNVNADARFGMDPIQEYLFHSCFLVLAWHLAFKKMHGTYT